MEYVGQYKKEWKKESKASSKTMKWNPTPKLVLKLEGNILVKAYRF